MLEQHPFPGKPIEGGRLDHRLTVGTGVGLAPVIGDGTEAVGSFSTVLIPMEQRDSRQKDHDDKQTFDERESHIHGLPSWKAISR